MNISIYGTWGIYFFELLNNLQIVMKKNDKEELNRLMAGWMDWNILSLKSADEVNGSSQLSSFEKTYCLSLFDLGEKEVWIAIDLWPSEHSK